ncbi:hypothetical protein DL96DRAFT_1589910 [Flagelloscypha sp. PMI_526]|nr:hypothetical protein DL96DRAFT_1589910 [Flagelloscypha sp. PMI_526]
MFGSPNPVVLPRHPIYPFIDWDITLNPDAHCHWVPSPGVHQPPRFFNEPIVQSGAPPCWITITCDMNHNFWILPFSSNAVGRPVTIGDTLRTIYNYFKAPIPILMNSSVHLESLRRLARARTVGQQCIQPFHYVTSDLLAGHTRFVGLRMNPGDASGTQFVLHLSRSDPVDISSLGSLPKTITASHQIPAPVTLPGIRRPRWIANSSPNTSAPQHSRTPPSSPRPVQSPSSTLVSSLPSTFWPSTSLPSTTAASSVVSDSRSNIDGLSSPGFQPPAHSRVSTTDFSILHPPQPTTKARFLRQDVI